MSNPENQPLSAAMQYLLGETCSLRERFPEPRSLADDGRSEFYEVMEPLCLGIGYRRYEHRGGEIIQIVPGNPWRNHYPLKFLRIQKRMEFEGMLVNKSMVKINPSDACLSDPSTGSAATASGVIGQLGGYRTLISVPREIPDWDPARAYCIEESNTYFRDPEGNALGEVLYPPEGSDFFLHGAINTLHDEIALRGGNVARRKGELGILNHASVPETVESARTFFRQACQGIQEVSTNGKRGAIVAGFGNGTSALGYGRESRKIMSENQGLRIDFHGFEGQCDPGAAAQLSKRAPKKEDMVTIYGCDGTRGLKLERVKDLISEGFVTKENHHFIDGADCRARFDEENDGKLWSETEGMSSIAARMLAEQLIENFKYDFVIVINYDNAHFYGEHVPDHLESRYVRGMQWTSSFPARPLLAA